MAALGYRARLPGSVVARIADRQPGAGAAIARGVSALGEVALKVHYGNMQVRDERADSEYRIAQLEQQRARAAAVADGMGRLAQLQLDTEEQLQSLRDGTDPGAPGYAAKAEEVYRQRWREFEGTLPRDPEVREHFAPMGARWLGSGISQERGWERERRVTHLGEQFKTSLDTYAASLFAQPSADTFQSLLTDFDSAIALQDIDGTAKGVLKQQVRETLTGALFDGMLQQGGFEAVEAAVGSGKFDAWLGGAEGKARWLDRAGAERDAAARAAEAAADALQRAAIDGLETIEARIGTDAPPTQAEINAALEAAKAAGVEDARLIKFADAGVRASRAATARSMGTPELEAQLRAIDAKRQGGVASPAEANWAEALEAELKARDVEAGGGIKELAKADPVAAAAQLAGMNVERRWGAAREAGEERLAVYANLTPQGRKFAVAGRELRGAREADFYPPADPRNPQAGGKAAADAQFRAWLGPDLIDQLGGAYDEHREAALDMMAGMSRQWDPRNFGRAVQMVFGQTLRPDGTAQGGLGTVRGRKVELPPKWTAAEFDFSYSRFEFPGAIYADGTTAKPEDVRRHFRPRYVGDEDGKSVYWLIGPDGRPLSKPSVKGGTIPYAIRFAEKP